MLDSYNVDPKRDLSNNREVLLDNGNSYHVVKPELSQYGFWTIHMDKGQVPDELKGNFTSPKEARLAITNYLNRKSRKVTGLKEKK
jgi:hypothetical protein